MSAQHVAKAFNSTTNFVYTAFKRVVYTVFVSAAVASLITVALMITAYKLGM